METPRIRTVRNLVAELKAMDANTDITENFVRYLIDTNQIRYMSIGNRYLINVDVFLEFLRTCPDTAYRVAETERKPKIRKIA